ncbi:MAG: PAS domain-containing protein [Candidatus Hydrogenedentes bacterium]|nr:PAS domain-containing protein [Candidatus Hydrogenedentota bacterium]
MHPCGTMLRSYLTQIAEAAADHVDAEALEEPLREVVGQLADVLGTGETIDTSPLYKAGADDLLIGRLLRASETEIIELLRAQSNGESFASNVLSLRTSIRKSLPESAFNPQSVIRYAQLIESDGSAGEPADLLRKVLQFVREVVFIHDINGNLLYVNEAGLEMVRYTRDDLIEGLSVYEIVVSQYIDLVEERMAAPSAERLSPFTIEVYAKDGERIPIEIDSRAVRDGLDGQPVFVGLGRDLRLEGRLHAEIRKANTRIENLLALAPAGILLTGPDGVIREANPLAVALCGAPSANALIGLDLVSLGDGDEDEIRSALSYAMESRKDHRFSLSMRSRFGTMMLCEAIVAPLELDDGSLDGVLILLECGTTHGSALEERVQEMSLSSLGEIVARAAHELNNPLTGIYGYAQYLHEAVEKPAHKDRLARIMEEADRCRRIGDNLLAFSNRGERKLAPHDINSILREAYSLCEYPLRVDHIYVTLDLDPKLPVIPCSAQDLERAFLNLIHNAHQALAAVEAGVRRLTLTTRQDAKAIHVQFADTGSGVRPDLQHKIFEPFFTTRDVGQGMGLGLSVAYAIAVDHGGTIRLESQPDKGATFTMVLPLHHSATEAAP